MAVDITYDGAWVHIMFASTITGADLTAVVQFAIDLESRVTVTPNRLVDFGPSTTLAIGFGDIANMAEARRATTPANPVRTAIVTHSAAQRGYARMFQTLNDHPAVTVAVFSDRAAAEAWLREAT